MYTSMYDAWAPYDSKAVATLIRWCDPAEPAGRL